MELVDRRTERVVALIDMDCFYCEVERRYNPSLIGKPVAVMQYNPFESTDHSVLSQGAEEERIVNDSNGSLIAVSYEARAAGVKRGSMRGREARAVCPQLVLVQVPTAHSKANLEIYRQAGAEVVALLAAGGTTERASVDEAYVDLTAEALRRLAAAAEQGDNTDATEALLRAAAEANAGGLDPGTHVSIAEGDGANKVSREDVRGGHAGTGAGATATSEETRSWWRRPLPMWPQDELLLAVGALITAELRASVSEQLGYSCSAGIAHNKIVAKLCCGLHKVDTDA